MITTNSKQLERTILQQMDETFTQQPKFFCSLQTLREKSTLIQSSFDGQVAYAVKANPRPEVIRTLVASGIRTFDVASIQEVRLVHTLAPKAVLLFNNPIKTPAEITEAAEKWGVHHYTVQDQTEIDHILKYTACIPREKLEIAVRLKAPNSSSARINHSIKFGVNDSAASRLLTDLAEKNIKTVFLSVHIGSDNPSASLQPYRESLESMYKLTDRYSIVKGINLGGGFPAQFYPDPKPNIENMLQELSQLFDKTRIKQYIIEPGLSMVANTAVLVTPIVALDNKSNTIRIRDGIYTSYYCYYVHKHPIKAYVYRRLSNGLTKITAHPTLFKVFGQTCDGGDFIDMQLPSAIRVGDMICLETAGAYMGSVASQFNGFEAVSWVFY